MSKYIEFKQVPFKGKTKRFEIISKTSFKDCTNCKGTGDVFCEVKTQEDLTANCIFCNGTGKVNIVLGKISWYPQWRQYTFSPSYPTIWNKDCLSTINEFINELMEERKRKKIEGDWHNPQSPFYVDGIDK